MSTTLPTPDLFRARERIIQALGVHYAHDDLSVDELDRRMELAFRATSHAELGELLDGLPPLPRIYDPGAEPATARMVGEHEVPPRGIVAALLGGAERKGRWLVPRHLKVWAIMGGVDLDLRQGRFAPGVTEVEVTAFMGGVDILVPPDVTVECTGMAFGGGFGASTGDADELDPDRPIVRITGMAVFGGVDAKVKEPKTGRLSRFEKRLAKMRKET